MMSDTIPSSTDNGQLIQDEDNTTALDLRVNKILSYSQSFIEIQNKKQIKPIVQLLESFYYNEACYENINYLCSNQSSYYNPPVSEEDYSESIIDYSTRREQTEQEVILDEQFKEAATNTDLNVFTDQGTQTDEREVKDAVSQANVESTIVMCETLNKLPNSNTQLPFLCSQCQKVYTTKNAYDRHLRAHLTNNQIQNGKRPIMNLKFLTKAKLKVYNRQVVKSNTRQDIKPIIVNKFRPGASDYCQQEFPSTAQNQLQLQLDYQKKNECYYELFPMTKCDSCPLKFYTRSCLDEHISIAHKKGHPVDDCYYCVFCHDKFDTAEQFHIHLDKHLGVSP